MSKSHERLAYRFATILMKLNQGEKLNPSELASEFKVNIRTIQRDLNVRFGFLPIVKENGVYSLDKQFFGQFSKNDITLFANLAGIQGLYPALDSAFLNEFFDQHMGRALMVQGHHYENNSAKSQEFDQLRHAIQNKNTCVFDYHKNTTTRKGYQVEPYRLINSKGIWYLIARDCKQQGQLKSYCLHKIHALRVNAETYVEDMQIQAKIDQEDSIWMSNDKQEVILKVSAKIIDYFKRRKLIPQQHIISTQTDGTTLISCQVAHPNQIMPIVQYWLPEIWIVSPADWQSQLEQTLARYNSNLRAG